MRGDASINLDLYFPLTEGDQGVFSALDTIGKSHKGFINFPTGFGNQELDQDLYGTLSLIKEIDMEELGVLRFALDEWSARHTSEQDDTLGRMAIYHSNQTCLQTCLTTHHSCREDTEPGWLPTRVLDLHHMALKLAVDIPLEQDRRYIALSHHWGIEPFLTLTRQNLAGLSKHVPYSKLRRTFRNAIDATNELGVRYLWIDSLCIIQGPRNESEWHREAGSMGLVYRNALLTLAACNAISIQSGFFDNPSNGAQFVINDADNTVIVAKNYGSPLAHRGWVLQEHLLAPRTVHLADPVVWECREMTVKRLLSRPFVFPTEPVVKVWKLRLKHSDCLSLWYQTVEKYSGCALSEPSDKLVAIGGLARTFSAVMQTDYIAGLWSKHIISGLLWETASKDSKRVGHYRAPSWSWASVEGIVKFNPVPDKAVPLAFQEKFNVVPVSSDEFGELRSGFLEVRGRLIDLGVSGGRASRYLIYKDRFLRISLDDFLSTDHGQMHLIPLMKIEAQKRYWSLLVTEKPGNGRLTPLYQRLGLVSTDLFARQEYFSGGHAPWTSVDWWPQLFYPRSRGETVAHAFTTEDFEGTAFQTLRLL
ncbi:heterokaryon incompatibility protein-domain-containing protein [Xylaria acuta]|nr:heterokaryon incompatibility protein-domain-containing protein [Xylaria acuta]